MNKIKEQLNRSVDNLPHPDMEKLWAIPVNKMETHDYITHQETVRPSTPVRHLALAVACFVCVCFAGFGWFFQNGAVNAIVSLDINPSFEILLNRRQTVLAVKALNADGVEVLKGRNYKGWDVEDTVETLMRSLDEEAYFTIGTENAVLLSVSSKNPAYAEEMSQRLSKCISEVVDRKETPTTILRQSYTHNKGESSESMGMSAGKLRLIQELAGLLPDYTVEDLSRLSLEDLERLVLSTKEVVPEFTVERSSWIQEDDWDDRYDQDDDDDRYDQDDDVDDDNDWDDRYDHDDDWNDDDEDEDDRPHHSRENSSATPGAPSGSPAHSVSSNLEEDDDGDDWDDDGWDNGNDDNDRDDDDDDDRDDDSPDSDRDDDDQDDDDDDNDDDD